MKVNLNGEYNAHAKVISDEQMDIIEQIAEDKIKEGATKITNAEFEIAPKRINEYNFGCELCQFNDICYHTEKDIQDLKEIKLKDIIGGEDDETDSETTGSDR